MAAPKRISQLPVTTTLSDADIFPVVKGGITYQSSLGTLAGSSEC